MNSRRVVHQYVAHETSSADFAEKTSFKQFVGSLFGFDFFISYAWADGRDYAVELAEKLEREADGKRYSCFLDSAEYSKGDDWKEAGKQALEKTSILILVGSPAALKSAPVLREVQIYTARKNRVIPIEFVDAQGKGTFGANEKPSEIHRHIRPEILRIKESWTYRDDFPSQLAGPSEDVVNQITGSFDLITQADKRARAFGAAALVFAIVAVLAIVFWRSSEANFAEAERQRKQAVQNEQKARSRSRIAESRRILTELGAISPLGEFGGLDSEYYDFQGNETKRMWQLKLALAVEAGKATDHAMEGLLTECFQSLLDHLRSPRGPITSSDFSALPHTSSLLERHNLGYRIRGSAVAATSNGRYVISGSTDGSVRLWDIRSHPPELKDCVEDVHSKQISRIVVCQNSGLVVTSGHDNAFCIWHIENGGLHLQHGPIQRDEPFGWIEAISNDGKWLVAEQFYDSEKWTHLWEVAAGQIIDHGKLMQKHDFIVQSAFTADNSWLVTGHKQDDEIRLLPLSDNLDIDSARTVKGFRGWDGFRVSNDGRWLAGRENTDAVVWSIVEREAVKLPEVASVLKVAFSNDSRLLATKIEEPGSVALWDVNRSPPKRTSTLELPSRADNPTFLVSDLAFDMTDRWLAISAANSATVYDLRSTTPGKTALTTSIGNLAGRGTLLFSEDSRWLIAATSDTAELSAWRWDDVYTIASSAGRNLSDKEWQRFFPEERFRETFSKRSSN